MIDVGEQRSNDLALLPNAQGGDLRFTQVPVIS